MGVISLLAGFDRYHITDTLMGGLIADQKVYLDYSSEWYYDIGAGICMMVFTSIFLNNFITVYNYIKLSCKRIIDRRCSNQMKLDPEDDENDRPNS